MYNRVVVSIYSCKHGISLMHLVASGVTDGEQRGEPPPLAS